MEEFDEDVIPAPVRRRIVPSASGETEQGRFEKIPGYHLATISRGEFGEASKITEEAAEFADAVKQGARVMELVELADLYGAIRGYLKRHHPTVTMDDLEKMSDITERAFKSGQRTSH